MGFSYQKSDIRVGDVPRLPAYHWSYECSGRLVEVRWDSVAVKCACGEVHLRDDGFPGVESAMSVAEVNEVRFRTDPI